MKEEEITVGIGVHLLSKLAGSAYISEKFRKNNLKCPCGCQSESLSFSAMYIGNVNCFTWDEENTKSH